MPGQSLANIYEEVLRAASRGDWKFSAELAGFSLTRLAPDANPVLWARFKFAHALALQALPAGDRAGHLEEAIAALQDAMAMHQRLAESALGSQERTASKLLLGKLHLARMQGSRAENVEAAIAALGGLSGSCLRARSCGQKP